MKMSPEAIAVIIYGIETAIRLMNEKKMTEEEIKEQARKDALRFAMAMEQMNSEIIKYGGGE